MNKMKKAIAITLCLITILSLILVVTACSKGGDLKVNFEVDGKIVKTVKTDGTKISMPSNPSKAGYVFDGWYLDKDVWTKPFTASGVSSAPFTGKQLTVYAKWKIVATSIRVISETTEYVAGQFSVDGHVIEVEYSNGTTTQTPLLESYFADKELLKTYKVGEQSLVVKYEGLETRLVLQIVASGSSGTDTKADFEGLLFQGKAVTYTGSPFSVTVQNVPEGATVQYEPSNTQTNAGTYSITATVSKEGYNTAALTAVLTIEKAAVTEPSPDLRTFTYNGSAQTYNIATSELYTVAGNVKTAAGSYTVTVSLKDTANYKWSTANNSSDLSYPFTIKESSGGNGGGDTPVYGDKELSIHFMELGNNYTGDSTYIKAGDVDILIDAGSRQNSSDTIATYVDQYCTDGKLEYVIATHAHQDHIAGFTSTNTRPSIFKRYECETIIDFARTNATSAVYNNYVAERDAEVAAGAKHYTALQCWNETDGAQRVYQLAEGITMTILYQRFYSEKSSDENNYSVCVLFAHGDKYFLFTGDLEKEGEASLVESNSLPQVELFKAGHHGSYTATTDTILAAIRPKMVCVCCCAGSIEYTQNLENTFPSQAFVNRVAPYTQKVYVTTVGTIEFDNEKNKYVDKGFSSLNGNINVKCIQGTVTVQCSNNNTLLKDTEWFKTYRTTPSAWEGSGGGGDTPQPTGVPIPAADTRTFTYTGAAQTYQIAANDKYTVTNNVQTNAGEYTVTVALKNKTADAWSDSTTADKTFTFTIAKAKVTEPAADTTKYLYTGAAQTYQIATSELYTVSGNTQTAAGTYDVTVALKDTANYVWKSAGNSDDLTFTFTIRASVVIPHADTYGSGTLEFHVLHIGSGSSSFGECVYVRAGDIDILIDSGRSTAANVTALTNYLSDKITGKLDYVILTYKNDANMGGFYANNGVFATYECGVIIDGLVKTDATYYKNYKTARDAEVTAGAKHYTALDCVNGANGAQATYSLGEGMSMTILYQPNYETANSTEANNSVCVLFNHGDKYFLFTGALKDESLILENNSLPEIDVLKAANQGAADSTSAAFLEVIKPKIVVISAYANATVPAQDFIDRIATYTDKVYVTGQKPASSVSPINGTIVVTSNAGTITVTGSNNSTILKESDWFAANRTKPGPWKEPQVFDIPEADPTVFTYTGEAQTYFIPANDLYTVTGNVQTAAGTYEVTVTLKYDVDSWSDSTKAPKTYTFTIGKAVVAIPEADTTVFTYDGTEKVYSIAENSLYTVTNYRKTNAGTYDVTVALKDKESSTWTDSTTADKTYTFTIGKASVTEPSADNTEFIYNGEEQTYMLATNAAYTITGNKQTNVGTYEVTVALNEPANYKWEGRGDSENLKFSFVIHAIPASGTMSIHILRTGGTTTSNSDCVYIKAGDTDILIDSGRGGTYSSSVMSYLAEKVTDGKLEYVIATNADDSRIGGFAGEGGIFATYVCETIIDFPRTKTNNDAYVAARDAEKLADGETPAAHFTALQCYNNADGAQRTYTLGNGMTMTFLYQSYYESGSISNVKGSVCVLFTHGEKTFLFTGDLESTGEASLIASNDLPRVDFFKVGAQGDGTTASAALLEVIRPRIVAVTTTGGTSAYPKPSQAFINAIAPYTDKVYVTGKANGSDGFNGNIVLTSYNGEITVTCSNTDTLLKDSNWMQARLTDANEEKRYTMPEAWQSNAELTVDAPGADERTFTYNGSAQTYVLASNDEYVITGNVQTNAGTYTITVALKHPETYTWSDTKDTADREYTFVIRKASVAIPVADGSSFTYDGTEKVYSINENDAYTITGNAQTAAGEYEVTVTLKDTANYMWSDESTEAQTYQFVIAKATVQVPAADERTFTYNGSEQTYVIATNAAYTVTNNVKTAAGNYTVTVALKNTANYKWSDGTTAAKGYPFSIAVASIQKPAADETAFTYTGAAQTYTLAANSMYTVSGNVRTNVGSYSVVVSLNDKESSKWADSSTDDLNFTFTIGKALVTEPAEDTTVFTYTSEAQTYTVAPSDYYTVSGNVKTYAGTYAVTISLLDKVNYQWANRGDSEDLSYDFVIGAPASDATMTIHVLRTNGGTGQSDCVYIKAGDTDILIDSGRSGNYTAQIINYLSDKVTDGKLEYVIATNADAARFGGYLGESGILATYVCETIIYFPRSSTSATDFITQISAEKLADGETPAAHYTALQCYNNQEGARRTYSLGSGMTMTFLYQSYYETGSISNVKGSVCVLFTHGAKTFLFTGDLESTGEASLIASNDLPAVDFFKVGYQADGSTASAALLEVIRPKLVAINSTAATTKITQDFIDRIAPYTNKVYVTGKNDSDGLNGNIVITSQNGEISVNCSNGSTVLKDSDWFESSGRTMPEDWKEAHVVPVPEADGTTFTYNGSAQTYNIAANKYYTVEGNVQTAAGNYTVTVTLKNEGDTWNDSTTAPKTFDFVIQAAAVQIPAANETVFTYNGSEQIYALTQSDLYTITNNVKTNAGEYTVTVALKDTASSAWNDSTTADKTYTFTIHKASIAEPAADDTTFIYNGNPQTYTIAANAAYTVSGATQTDIGNYVVTVSLKDKTNHQWATAGNSNDLTFDFVISKNVVMMTVYYFNSNGWETVNAYAWTGEEKFLGEWPGKAMTAVDGKTGWYQVSVDSDAAKVIFTNGLDGADNKTADLDLNASTLYYNEGWMASFPTVIQIPAADNTTFTYDGTEQTYTLATNDAYTISGNVQTNAGSYTVTVALKNKRTTVWSDWTTADKTYTFVIGEVDPDVIEIPAENGATFTYNGTAQTYALTTNDAYTISNNVQTNAGSYQVTVALKNKTTTIWSDSTTADKTFTFTIGKASVAEPAADTTVFTYTGEAQTYTIAANNLYTVSGNVQTNIGNYEVTVALKDKTNYKWATFGNSDDLTFDFVISKNVVMMTVYYFNSNGWETVNAYAWSGTQPNEVKYLGEWPGKAMTAVDGKTGWYQVSVDSDAAKVIFTNGLDGDDNKTADLDLNASTLYYNEGWMASFPTVIEIPAADDTTFTYDGTEQTYTLATNDAYTISGNVQTSAGTYTVTVALKNKRTTVWSDWTTADKTYTFVIGEVDPEVIEIPAENGATFTYNGTAQTYALTANDAYTISNNVQTNAGSYQVTVALKNKTTTIWTDSTTEDKTFTFTIGKATVQVPAEDETVFTYTGSAQTYTVTANALYTVSGNSQTNAGSYDVTIALKNASNYKWSTGNSNALSYDFVIGKKPVTEPAADETVFTYNGSAQTYNIEANAAYTVTGATQTNVGNYKVTVSLNDKSNYKWATSGNSSDLSYDFVINEYVEYRTIYFYNASGWETVKAYAWKVENENNVPYLGEWSGKAMTAVDGKPGWFEIEVNAEATKIVFNNGSSGEGNQTADLTINPSALYYNDGWRTGFTTLIAAPAANETVFTYNGSAQTYALTENAAYTISGNVQTNAGSYTVTVSLKDKAGTAWTDSTTADKTYSFVIGKASIAEPAADGTTFTYNGSAQTYNIAANAAYTVTGATQTAADTYTVTVSLNDKTNYKWTTAGDSEDLEYEFVIGVASVVKPTADGTTFYYTGSAQTYNIPANAMYTVTGNVQTDVGEHTVTVALKNTTSSKWADSSTADLTFTFVINKVLVAAPAQDETVYRYTGSAQSYNIPANEAYTVTNGTQTAIGTYEVTVALKDKTNYEWSGKGNSNDLTYSFRIKGRVDIPQAQSYGSGQMTFHILKVNASTYAECVYVKAGDVDILIGCGYDATSAAAIHAYLEGKVTDGVIEYLIVTHLEQQVVGGLFGSDGTDGLLGYYSFGTIIEYAKNKSSTAAYYKNYCTNATNAHTIATAAGSTWYTAMQCVNGADGAQATYAFNDYMSMTILYQTYYDHTVSTSDQGSVCVLFNHGSKYFLFTGDLDDAGEASLVANNELPEVSLFRVGNKGSGTVASTTLLDVIQPENVAISTYTANSGAFTQDLLDRIAPYTTNVYVTAQNYANAINGNIVVTSNAGVITVTGSNNSTILKDSAWFANTVAAGARTMPEAWQGSVTSVTIPTADNTTFTYNGTAQTYTVAASDYYTVTGATQTNAGEYTVTVALKNKIGTAWTDTTTADKTFTFTIAKATVEEPAEDDTVFYYTGSAQTYNVAANAAYTVTGATQTAVGNYNVTVALNDKTNYEWATAGNSNDLTFSFVINPAIEYRTVYYYNSNGWQSVKAYAWKVENENNVPRLGEWPGEDMIAVKGKSGWFEIEVNADATKIVFNNGSNGNGNQTDDLTIDPSNLYYRNGWRASYLQAIEAPAENNATFTYTGSAQTYTLATNAAYTITGATQTNAGSYTVTVALNDTNDAIWSDSTSEDKTFTFTIGKASVQEPASDNTTFTYNGSAQTYDIAANALYTVSGNVQTDVGNYTVTVSLNDKTNYKWATADNSDNLEYPFVINALIVYRTVYFYNTNNWQTVKAYAWTGEGNNKEEYLGAWAGTAMTAVDGKAGWYQVSVEEDAENIIFTNGTAQTDDLEINPSALYYNEGWRTGFVALIAIPAQNNATFTYTGSAQTYTIAANDAYTITGATQTNAGSYTVTVALKNTTTTIWTDGTTANKTYSFTINKATVQEPAADPTTFTYTGSAQTYNIAANALYTVSGNVQTDVGNYTVTVSLNDKSNYEWASAGDSEDLEYDFVIGEFVPTVIQVPAEDETYFVYTGSQQTYNIPTNAAYTISGNKKTSAGEYTVTVALNDKEATVWSDSTTEDKTYTFVIHPASIEEPAADPTVFYYTGEEQTYTLATSDRYTITNNVQTNVGTYTVTVKLRNKTNYVWATSGTTANLSYTFVIHPAIEYRTIYYYKSNNAWQSVNAHAWKVENETDVPLLGNWPGTAMTAVEGKAGWYSVSVNTEATKIIFNNGSSGEGNQTADLTIDPSNLYYRNGWRASYLQVIEVPAENNATFTYTGSAQTYTLATNAAYTITNNVQTNADTYTVTVTLNDTNDSVWSDSTNAPKTYTFTIDPATVQEPAADDRTFYYTGNAQTYNIAANALYTVSGATETDVGNYTVTVSLNDKSNYKWATADNTDDLEYSFVINAAIEYRTVYFYNTNNWQTVKAHAWKVENQNDVPLLGEWPGTAMTAVDGKAGWYQVSVNAEATKIIFNNGSSGEGNQTADLTINPSALYYNEGWRTGFVALIAIPAANNTTFTYTGSAQTYTIAANDAYTISGNVQTNADTYTVTVALKNTTTTIWTDGTTADKTYTFTIGKKAIAKPAENNSTFTYTGAAQTYTLTTNAAYEITGNVQTNAGNHTVTVALNDTDNTCWTDQSITDLVFTFTIGKASVQEPAEDPTVFYYTGSAQTYTVASNALYTVSDNVQTEVGTYSVTISLNDDANYKWATAGDSNDLSYTFVIHSAIEYTSVYYYNENGWANVYAYAWSGTGNNATKYLGDFPGAQMTAVPGKANWFTIEINEAAENVVFSNGTNQNKTADLEISASTPYYYDGEWLNAYPVITEPVYYYNENSWNTVKAYAWSGENEGKVEYLGTWSGTAMTPVAGRAGWYQINVNVDATKIIFTNGLDGNANKTSDITLDEDDRYYFEGDWYPGDPVDYRTLYFFNASDWGTVKAYAWSGTNPNTTDYLEAWPGATMTAVAGKTGWVKIDVNEDAEYVVFSNGSDSSEKTTDLTIDFSAPYYYLHDWLPDYPVITETVYYYNSNGWANVYAYAWSGTGNEATKYLGDFPGAQMTAVEGKEGWYQVDVNVDAVNIVFSNGTNQNKTADLDLDFSTPYYKTSWTATYPPEIRTIYFCNTNGWTNVYAYAWSGSGNNATDYLESWPGSEMTLVDVNWYEIDVDTAATNIIFSNGSGGEGNQTADLTIDPDALYYVYGEGWTTSFSA